MSIFSQQKKHLYWNNKCALRDLLLFLLFLWLSKFEST